MRWIRDDRGTAMVLTLVIAPLLLVALAGVLQLGALRVAAARVRAAADLASLVAVNDQDDAELASSGALRLAADAADVAREYFARELELSSSLLDGGAVLRLRLRAGFGGYLFVVHGALEQVGPAGPLAEAGAAKISDEPELELRAGPMGAELIVVETQLR